MTTPHQPTALRRRGPLAVLVLLAAGADAATLEIRVSDQHGEPLQHAVVTAQAGNRALPGGDRTDTIAQSQQQFLPRVTVIPVGAGIRFPNRDTTQHHVYSFSPAKTFEIELYKGDLPNPVIFENAGIVALGCNIHDWMLGYVYVTNDDYFATSDADGRLSLPVSIDDAEDVKLWHPAARAEGPQSLDIQADAAADGIIDVVVHTRADNPLDFEIDPLQALFREAGE